LNCQSEEKKEAEESRGEGEKNTTRNEGLKWQYTRRDNSGSYNEPKTPKRGVFRVIKIKLQPI
jgi:hypothetical protein